MKIINKIHFGIQRKIVSNMTSESWETIPHVTYMYKPDVSNLIKEYKKLNINRNKDEKITVNTLMLKIISEGLKEAPIMNSHINFNRKLVRGEITTFENVDISMPMVLPNGEMMTVNLHNFENKSLDEMTAVIKDTARRAAQSDINEAMFEVSLDNTLTSLKKGKILQAIFRLIGSKTGKYKVKTLKGKEKKKYMSIPETERLTKHDIKQGTVTISNIGSIYRGQKGATALLEIIPPQVTAFALGAIQDKPVVVSNIFDNKTIEVRQVLPICIAFDHRALDFGDIVPFLKKLDNIFENPSIIHSWVSNNHLEAEALEA